MKVDNVIYGLEKIEKCICHDDWHYETIDKTIEFIREQNNNLERQLTSIKLYQKEITKLQKNKDR